MPEPPLTHPAGPPHSVGTPRPDGEPARARLIAVGEVLLCSSVPTQFVIGRLLMLAGLDPPVPGEPLPLAFVLALSLLDTVVLIALMVLLTHAHSGSVRTLWLGERPVAGEALRGLAYVPLVFLMVVVLLNLLRLLAPWLRTVEVNPLEALAAMGTAEALALGVVAIVAGGVREELQRAFLLVRFEHHLGGATAGVIVLSVAFGLGHAIQGADAVIVTGALGAFWAVMYLRRRSSVAPVVSHAGFNALEILRVALTRR